MSLVANDYLASLHLQATSCGFVCCKYCCIALGVEDIVGHASHFAGHSQTPAPQMDHGHLKVALKACNISSKLPSPPVEHDIPPVPGLALVDGWWCMHCRYASATLDSMKEHQQLHSTIPSAARTSVQGSIQQLNSTTRSTWFRVHIPSSVTPTSTASITQLLEQLQDALAASANLAASDGDNVHNVSAWLRTCNWHIFTRALDVAEARKLVSAPTDPAFAVLVEAIEQYMAHACSLIDCTHPSIRKMLNSENPLVK